MSHRPRITSVAAAFAGCALALALGACSQQPATVTSASASGEVAGWGTKGVEATIVNGTQRAFYYAPLNADVSFLRVGERVDGVPSRALDPGQSTTFSGNKSGVDDIELSWTGPLKDQFATNWLDMDFSNPTMGCPNASVGWDIESFCSEGTEKYYFPKVGDRPFTVLIKREADSADNKRFTATIIFSRN